MLGIAFDWSIEVESYNHGQFFSFAVYNSHLHMVYIGRDYLIAYGGPVRLRTLTNDILSDC